MGTQSESRRTQAVYTRPLRVSELSAVERRPKLTILERQLLETLKETMDALAAAKGIESDPDEKRGAYDPREKVLVVVAWDGWTEIYAEPWVDVKVVECWPWDDETAIVVPDSYAQLQYPNKLRGTALAKMCKKPGMVEVLMRYTEHQERMEAIERLTNLAADLARARPRTA